MNQYIGTKMVKATPLYSGGAAYLLGRKVKEGDESEDGYQSWSPKAAFEKAYRCTNNMTFGLALEALKGNKRVSRAGWNGKKMWLRVVIPGGDNKEPDMGYENLPYIEMKTADNKLVPWLASQTDMLAEDWRVVDES